MAASDMLLELESITKSYGRNKALDNVSFDLAAGEIHCLVGENGAGKSTLIKILAGAIVPDSGRIRVGAENFTSLNPAQAMELGISTIYQDVELIESLSVADNIFLGSERKSRIPGVVDTRAQLVRAREIMDALSIDIDERSLVEDLSGAQKQMLQIVKAFHDEANIIIMDEPTSSLGVSETRALMTLVRDLRARGVGIIYISHYLEEVFEIGDRITILKDGVSVGTHRRQDVDFETVVRLMVGRDASSFFARAPIEIGDTQFEVRDFSRDRVVREVSFSVRCGEIFGIGGIVGSGRSELACLIFGAARRDAGSLHMRGRQIEVNSPRQAIRHGICLLTEDRKDAGLFSGRPVHENVMAVKNELLAGLILNLRAEGRIVNNLTGKLEITIAGPDQLVEELSGGNQQKVLIARWLLSEASVFIFDEPTKGVDIGAKEHIYHLMVELAAEGKSVIMISSDMPELISMSDRIGVMRNGRMTHILPAENLDEEDLIRCFVGADDLPIASA
ncbi:MAG: sugar ABC transporter ATP-binding protein [Phycisphaerae bacterium]|jgi:ribose transport system ATP-binding protein|nr:sugar ABC transporter ATP-binding protein [Phycisphaerae bacterium]